MLGTRGHRDFHNDLSEARLDLAALDLPSIADPAVEEALAPGLDHVTAPGAKLADEEAPEHASQVTLTGHLAPADPLEARHHHCDHKPVEPFGQVLAGPYDAAEDRRS